MLFNYLYILNNFEPVFFDTTQQSETFIIPVNTNITGKKPAVFETLFRSASSFCFSISDNIAGANKTFIQTEIIQNFSRLLFLPNYLRIGGKQVLFIDPANSNRNASLVVASILVEAFRKQGIDILLVEPRHIAAGSLHTANEPAVWHDRLNSFLCTEDTLANFESFTNNFSLPLYFNTKWLVRVSSLGDLQKKKNQLEKFDTWLKGTQSFKVQLMEMVTAATAEKDSLKAENKLLAFKLENSAHYLKLMREESMGLMYEIGRVRADIQRGTAVQPDDTAPGSDYELIAHYQKVLLEERKRADDTLNWYLKEYEVLPRWFKRLGQLIRVLMGKRSFGSLLNKAGIPRETENHQQVTSEKAG